MQGIQALIKREQELAQEKHQFKNESEFIKQIQDSSQVLLDYLIF
jgi:hypothetical protein